MKKYDVTLKRRIYGLLGLFSLFSLLLAAGAFQHQVLRRGDYNEWADKQHYQPVRLIPLRGRILDRGGNPMAVSLKAGSVFAHPATIRDPEAVARRLAPLLGGDPERLAGRMARDASFTWLARQIPLASARKVRDMRLPGVGIETEGKRYYPNRELAGHVLGFTGVDSQGLEGLEWAFDRQLKGQPGQLRFQRDARGRVLWQEVPGKPGNRGCCELELTLDLRIQFFAEEALNEAVRSSGALSGAVVAMDPRSGEILAMACAPAFDPNGYRRSSPSRWRNRALADAFEPGSTIKVFTVAAALEEGRVREDTRIFCENGSFRYGRCLLHDMKPHGELSVREILMVSSNIGVAKIADELGGVTLHRYLKAFGFGRKTGVDLPGEVAGQLRDAEGWSQVAVATHAFGQGFSASALQVARAFSVLANGGCLVRPYLVRAVRDEQGRTIQETTPVVEDRVLSPRTARRVLDLMESVVLEGTGAAARVPGYRVGGKTGTAQKYDAAAGAYSDERSVVSFVGVLPLEAPEMVVAVVLDEPQGKASGGRTAAPVFGRIASRGMHYRRVPDGVREVRKPVPAVSRVSSLGEHAGPGGRIRPAAAPAFRGAGVRQMPDVRFQPLRSALRMLDGIPAAVRLEGTGTVVSQEPVPGSPVGDGSTLVLRALPVPR